MCGPSPQAILYTSASCHLTECDWTWFLTRSRYSLPYRSAIWFFMPSSRQIRSCFKQPYSKYVEYWRKTIGISVLSYNEQTSIILTSLETAYYIKVRVADTTFTYEFSYRNEHKPHQVTRIQGYYISNACIPVVPPVLYGLSIGYRIFSYSIATAIYVYATAPYSGDMAIDIISWEYPIIKIFQWLSKWRYFFMKILKFFCWVMLTDYLQMKRFLQIPLKLVAS